MFQEIWKNVQQTAPLVHCITNYVTVNDVANIVLACGGSPIMADEEDEAAEIATLCSSLCLNIGTLNRRTIPAMLCAGRAANAHDRAVLVDPVGAGASKLRTHTALQLIKELRVDVVRGNISEIKALVAGSGTTKGVDADAGDLVREDNVDEAIALARTLSRNSGAIVAISGPIDVISDGERVYLVRNGDPMMSRVTGTGCMLSAVVAAYIGANPAQKLESTALAFCMMGLCGEIAAERTRAASEGTASFSKHLIDAVSCLQYDTLKGGMQIENR